MIAGLILAGFAALAAVALFNLSSIAHSKKKVQLARAEESLGRKESLPRISPWPMTGMLNGRIGQDRRAPVTGARSVRGRYAGIFTARDTVFDELKSSFISTLGAA